jgi:hypothetical protein
MGMMWTLAGRGVGGNPWRLSPLAAIFVIPAKAGIHEHRRSKL